MLREQLTVGRMKQLCTKHAENRLIYRRDTLGHLVPLCVNELEIVERYALDLLPHQEGYGKKE